MSAITSQHGRAFKALVMERRQIYWESMGNGVPADYESYRQMVGYLQGLDEALKLSEQADFQLNGAEPYDGA